MQPAHVSRCAMARMGSIWSILCNVDLEVPFLLACAAVQRIYMLPLLAVGAFSSLC